MAGRGRSFSPDGNDLAYWLPDKHELHVFSIPDRIDTILDTIPRANMRQMAWSAPGRVLVYAVRDPNQSGAHSIDLDTGKRAPLPRAFGEISASPDPAYVVTVNEKGVQRFRIA